MEIVLPDTWYRCELRFLYRHFLQDPAENINDQVLFKISKKGHNEKPVKSCHWNKEKSTKMSVK